MERTLFLLRNNLNVLVTGTWTLITVILKMELNILVKINIYNNCPASWKVVTKYSTKFLCCPQQISGINTIMQKPPNITTGFYQINTRLYQQLVFQNICTDFNSSKHYQASSISHIESLDCKKLVISMRFQLQFYIGQN